MPISKILMIVVMIFCVSLSSNVFSCEVNFDGSLFLKALHAKGAVPSSTCHETNLPQNRFFALPDKSCEIVFPKTDWLTDGWKLIGIQGGGTFNVQTDDRSITIKIRAAGGFRLIRATVHSDEESCGNVTLDMVLNP